MFNSALALSQSYFLVNQQDYYEKTPLILAARLKKSDIFRSILESGANPFFINKHQESPILEAFKNHHIFEKEIKTILSMLTYDLFEEDLEVHNLFQRLIYKVITEDIRWIFDYIKSNIPFVLKDTSYPKHNTYLNLAIKYNRPYIVESLCDLEDLLDLKDINGNTPIMNSILQEKPIIVNPFKS